MRLIKLLLFFLSICYGIKGQNYPTDYFVPPLDGILQLSGTFAELRGNHFHSGIDLRTGSKEGLPVKACAEGYVVRIKISPIGFGKAIYINHPNGYTTVYAHMQGFTGRINDWIRAEQYKKESFDVDLFPPKNLLPVEKGEIIGTSGNSGSSEGPHLHFEVRETETELPVDPVLFGFPVKDFIRPAMQAIRLYPEGSKSSVNGFIEPQTLPLAGWGPVHRLKISDTVEISGNFSIGITASDLLNETSNKNGIVGYSIFIDSVLMFEWKAVKFSFAETRFINSFIDYSYYYATNQRFMRSHIDPGNKLSMYSYAPTRGIFSTSEGSMNFIKVIVTDSKRNEAILRFIVKGTNAVIDDDHRIQARNMNKAMESRETSSGPSGKSLVNDYSLSDKEINKTIPGQSKSYGLLFTINKLNTVTTPDMRFTMPGKCLYDSIRFEYAVLPSQLNMYSKVHQIHTPEVPLHDYYDLSIKVDTTVPIDPQKFLVVRLNSQNRPSAAGGKFENGFMKVRLRDFGKYAVMSDTTAPEIRAVNVKNGMKTSGIQELKVAIKDNLSGIRSYRGTLNGAWILMDYDAKSRMLTYKRDALLLEGENVLVVTVEDNCGNTSVMQWNFSE